MVIMIIMVIVVILVIMVIVIVMVVVVVVVVVIVVVVMVVMVVADLLIGVVGSGARVAQDILEGILVVVQSLLDSGGQVILLAVVVAREDGLERGLALVRGAGSVASARGQGLSGLGERVRSLAVHLWAGRKVGVELARDEAVLVLFLEVVDGILVALGKSVVGAVIVVRLKNEVLLLACVGGGAVAVVRGVLEVVDRGLDSLHVVAAEGDVVLFGEARALLVRVVVVVFLGMTKMGKAHQEDQHCGCFHRHRRGRRGRGCSLGRREWLRFVPM